MYNNSRRDFPAALLIYCVMNEKGVMRNHDAKKYISAGDRS